jgi:hypothetical protein
VFSVVLSDGGGVSISGGSQSPRLGDRQYRGFWRYADDLERGRCHQRHVSSVAPLPLSSGSAISASVLSGGTLIVSATSAALLALISAGGTATVERRRSARRHPSSGVQAWFSAARRAAYRSAAAAVLLGSAIGNRAFRRYADVSSSATAAKDHRPGGSGQC